MLEILPPIGEKFKEYKEKKELDYKAEDLTEEYQQREKEDIEMIKNLK